MVNPYHVDSIMIADNDTIMSADNDIIMSRDDDTQFRSVIAPLDMTQEKDDIVVKKNTEEFITRAEFGNQNQSKD